MYKASSVWVADRSYTAWDFKTYCLFYFGISFGNWTLGSVSSLYRCIVFCVQS